MFFVSKAVCAGIALLLLTTGISGPGPPITAEANSSKEMPAAGDRTDVKKVQQTLWGKGHYRGKMDGVLGLRTRASIRGFQKAENLPVTGQLDALTAHKLGVSPLRREEVVRDPSQSKPSARVLWTKGSGRTPKTLHKAVKTSPVPESGRLGREKPIAPEND
ncbi:MAG: peptidoglycan-binding protein [Acidobacteriia bacterium]|nr:peptidoglycan-binding protein [Terriglobia bacterium]